MNHKSSYSYKIIFNFLEQLVKTMKINFNLNDTHKIIDFEHQFRKTINEIFPNCNLEGVFFSLFKADGIKRKYFG